MGECCLAWLARVVRKMRDHASLGGSGGLHGNPSDPRLSILTQAARHLAAKDAVSFRPEPFGPELMAEGQPGTVVCCIRGGCSAKSRFSRNSCQTIRHMRRAMMVIAVLAFLPRSRCRL